MAYIFLPKDVLVRTKKETANIKIITNVDRGIPPTSLLLISVNVFGSPVTDVLLAKIYKIPRRYISAPNVTIKEGILVFETINPLTAPKTQQTATVNNTAGIRDS